MTADAQAALRRIMEKYSRITRFCLVCNYVSRVIEPLASRCTKFRFKSLPREQAIGRVSEVARLEGVDCEDGALEALVDCAEGDLRRAMMSLQSASRMVQKNRLTAGMVTELVGVIPGAVIENLRNAWGGSSSAEDIQLAVDDLIYNGYPASRVLSQLHDLVTQDQQLSSMQKAKIAMMMGSVDKALCDGADEQLQMMDLMMQASKIVAQVA
ncbi:Subunit of heteropentameric Replication factor C (RF-C) [Coemansia sp. RSA 2599]|nr:Subunit of heteropentameric Replication factor C (RF-C) [Coemansia sp. RSA 2598]KAJ1803072.1 Subunit of heteropentameric Replication factor C (RF-C) [Coemansia sp. RSA 2599]